MKYVDLKGMSKSFSRLIYGTATDRVWGNDPEAAVECLDMAFEAGFRAFDTGHTYQNAEKHLGIWMARRGNRDKVILVDKGCNPGQTGGSPGQDKTTEELTAETVKDQIRQSQERFQSEYIDMYVLHRDDPARPVDEIIDVLNQYKQDGVIGGFGASNWTLPRLIEAEKYAAAHGLETFSATSPAYSLAVYMNDPWGGSVALSGEEQADFRAWLENNQLPVFAYSSLARGFLSGKFRTDNGIPIEDVLWFGPIQEYDCPENRARLARAEKLAAETGAEVSQIALAWLLAQPQNIFPIVCPSSEKHMKTVVDSLDISISREQADWLLNG